MSNISTIADVDGITAEQFGLPVAEAVWAFLVALYSRESSVDTTVAATDNSLATAARLALACIAESHRTACDHAKMKLLLARLCTIDLYGPPLANRLARYVARVIGTDASAYMLTPEALLQYVTERRSCMRLPYVAALEAFVFSASSAATLTVPNLTTIEFLIDNYDIDRIHAFSLVRPPPHPSTTRRVPFKDADLCMRVARAPVVGRGIFFDEKTGMFEFRPTVVPTLTRFVHAICNIFDQQPACITPAAHQLACDTLMILLLANDDYPIGMKHVRACVAVGATLRALAFLVVMKCFAQTPGGARRQSISLRDIEHADAVVYKQEAHATECIIEPVELPRSNAVSLAVDRAPSLYHLAARTYWATTLLSRVCNTARACSREYFTLSDMFTDH